MLNKIQKKDFVYWIIILIFIIIILSTKNLGSNSNIVNYISFAGTITSILLAVIAIIYSFVQNNAFENTTNQLTSSANKVEIATQGLKNINILEEQLSNIIHTIHATRETQESLVSQLEDIKFDINSMNILNTKVSSYNLENFPYSKEEILTLLNTSNINLFIAFIYFYNLDKKEIPDDITNFLRYYINTAFASNGGVNEDNFYGFYICALQVFGSLGGYKFSFNNNIVNVSDFNQQFQDALNELIEEVKLSDVTDTENMHYFYNCVEKYFENK